MYIPYKIAMNNKFKCVGQHKLSSSLYWIQILGVLQIVSSINQSKSNSGRTSWCWRRCWTFPWISFIPSSHPREQTHFPITQSTQSRENFPWFTLCCAITTTKQGHGIKVYKNSPQSAISFAKVLLVWLSSEPRILLGIASHCLCNFTPERWRGRRRSASYSLLFCIPPRGGPCAQWEWQQREYEINGSQVDFAFRGWSSYCGVRLLAMMITFDSLWLCDRSTINAIALSVHFNLKPFQRRT